MEYEEEPYAVPYLLSSDCGNGWFHQDDGGDGGDDDVKPGWMRCRSSVLGYHFVPLGGDGDGWTS